MKFQPDRLEGVNAITRHERGRIWVRAAQHEGAVLALEPELVVFGSGERLRFAAPALLRGLIERRIGVETMDTAAACRTFNVLAGEGRCVVAALLLDGPAAALPEA